MAAVRYLTAGVAVDTAVVSDVLDAVVDDDDALVVIVYVERQVAAPVSLLMPSEGNDEELVLEVAVERDKAAMKTVADVCWSR